MGFLKFLKKGKKEKEHIDESLDVPPPPPPIKEGLPEGEFPPFKFKEERPIPVTEEKLPALPKEEEIGLEVPVFPSLEETPKFMPKPPMEEPIKEIALPKEELIKPELEEPVGEKIEAVVTEEKKPSKKLISKGLIYIRLDGFKETLKSISKIKSALKKSDEFLYNLIKSKEEKVKDFEKWHGIMEDMQKKLIFIDKTLFKGD